ncbi:MAG: hypothetical protein PHE24_05390 [Patescibacteria group bacterium]|nr:hypothetical protein [Patescibacteria group bacterium]
MSLNIFSYCFSLVITALIMFGTHSFFLIPGTPQTIYMIILVILWVTMSETIKGLLFHSRVAALVEKTGTMLFFKKKNRFVFRGCFVKNYELTGKLTIVDSQRDFIDLPVEMIFNLEFKSVRGSRLLLKLEKFTVAFDFPWEQSEGIRLLDRYQNKYLARNAIEAKIRTAVGDVLAEETQMTGTKFSINNDELRLIILQRISASLEDEFYHYKGDCLMSMVL